MSRLRLGYLPGKSTTQRRTSAVSEVVLADPVDTMKDHKQALRVVVKFQGHMAESDRSHAPDALWKVESAHGRPHCTRPDYKSGTRRQITRTAAWILQPWAGSWTYNAVRRQQRSNGGKSTFTMP